MQLTLILVAALTAPAFAIAQSRPTIFKRAATSAAELFSAVRSQQDLSTQPAEQMTFTTENGAPSASYFGIQRAGENGPLLMQSTALLDGLAHFVRERLPERVVHARGWGARGYLEITTDFAEKYSMANIFKKSEKTWALCRFSTVGGGRGSPDVARDPRGFACKFKTKSEGVLDWVFNNTPVFFIRNPLKFPSFIHTQKTVPQTNLRSPDMVFDYLWQNPEASMQFMRLFSDAGTPYGARHMNGWSGHTYRLVKQDGSWVYVKVQLFTDQGIRNFTAEEAAVIGGQHQEWATADLFEAIENKNYPSWTVKFAIKTEEEAAKYRYNVNDLTKDWPDAQWHEVGKLVLDTNPLNYHEEIEQAHFSPSNMVSGWAPSEDPVLQSRLFSYNDAGRYRLGANYAKLPVNCPMSAVANFDRDGLDSSLGGFGKHANYPSSAGTYKEPGHANAYVHPVIKLPHNTTTFTYEGDAEAIDLEQPRHFYQKELSEHGRQNIAGNFGGALAHVKQPGVVDKTLKLMAKIDERLAKDVHSAIEKAKQAKSTVPTPGGESERKVQMQKQKSKST